jgi:glutamyl-tRNA synthetase
MEKFRVRFAPSPTGALHIGGVRTALFNYLLAKKNGGTFLIRVEDTDQTRFVEGAEDYIMKSLAWLGIMPTEGPNLGGNHTPYRQSERKEMYMKYALDLVASGNAYYAFDSTEDLTEQRNTAEKAGGKFQYGAATRHNLRNSLTLSEAETQELIAKGDFVIRMKIPTNVSVVVNDIIRGAVTVNTAELDDKVLMKADGMPTYHLANIVDDHEMEISHVIRGEEWLPSAAHHVLLYQFFNWEAPRFAHLSLILKPDGNGKLSKRDGAKFGFPVFPIDWAAQGIIGFDGFGFDPKAVINFLALLGWNSGTDQEIFSLEELVEVFSLEKINKSGARFDFDKAKWFNQQYIKATANEELAAAIRPEITANGHHVSDAFLATFCGLMKERVVYTNEFWSKGAYFFEGVKIYDDETIKKRYKAENRSKLDLMLTKIAEIQDFKAVNIDIALKEFMASEAMKPGDVLPIWRLALSGTMQGPDVMLMAELLEKEETIKRLKTGLDYFDALLK